MSTWRRLDATFRAAAPSETGAFLFYRQCTTRQGQRLLVQDFRSIKSWDAQRFDFLRPTAQSLSAAIGEAIERNLSLGFVHSHPFPGAPRLSPLDEATSEEWARTLLPSVESFASLVWSPTGLAGNTYGSAAGVEISELHAVGEGEYTPLSAPPRFDSAVDNRQERALGELGNRVLRDLRVGLVGLGGTGSPLAEILARMGVRSLLLIDPERIDTPSNLRRVAGSTSEDLEQRTPKVEVSRRHIQSIVPECEVTPLAIDVRSEASLRALLDCDLVMASTDNHSSRAFLNQVAVQYWLPTVDIGVRIGLAADGRISGMPMDIRVLLPDTGCLWCRSLLDSDLIRAENLPTEERIALEAEGYVRGLPRDVPSIAALNYAAAASAALTAVRLTAGSAIVSPALIVDLWEQYVQEGPADTSPQCICHDWRGVGDSLPIPVLAADTRG